MSEKRERGRILQARVSDAELSKVAERADRAGLTIGSYIRQVLLGGVAPRAVRQPPLNRVLIAEILQRLGPVATDLRALAKGEASGNDSLDAALGDLAEIRDALMRALGRNP